MEITDDLVRYITDELWKRLDLGGEAPPAAVKPVPRAGRRQVLSEAEVRAACPAAGGPGQVLSLSPDAILTPLARDYILSMKISLVRN